MRRALKVFIPLVLAVVAALFLMTVPGAISISAGDLSLEAPVWLGGIALLILLLVVVAVMRIAGSIGRGFARRGAERVVERRTEGEGAIVSALAALAAGNGSEARRTLGRARRLLGETPVVLLLEGHAARALGDDGGARRAFARLSDVGPPGAFLGHRGLAALALEQGDREAAAAAGRAALAMRPEAAWARSLVFDAAARAGDWSGALALLPKAKKGTEEALSRAVLLLGAAEAEAERDSKAALRMAEEAVELAPTLAPAHALRVRLLRARGERRRAAGALERGLVAAPHPLLAELALEPQPGEDQAAVARRVEALAEASGKAGEAELAAAQAALRAGLWAKARRHAQRAREGGLEDRRVFLLLAEVAAGEFAGTEAARTEAQQHLREASAAAPEPAWWCAGCGTRAEAWAPVCRSCGAVATLAWGSTPRAALPAPRTLLAAPVPGL